MKHNNPQSQGNEDGSLDRADLHQCRRELVKEIDRLEFTAKRDAIQYDLKEQIGLLYEELDYIKLLLK